MKPALLGLAIPTIASAAVAVGRTAASVTKPFASALHAAADLLDGSTQSGSPTVELSTKSGSELDPLVEHLNLVDIREHADELQNGLEQRLSQLLSDLGIELDEPMNLRISRFDGQLEVEGDISQRAVLEAALAHDPSIAADFRHLAAMRQLLAVADEQHATPLDKPFQATLKPSDLGRTIRLDFRDAAQ